MWTFSESTDGQRACQRRRPTDEVSLATHRAARLVALMVSLAVAACDHASATAPTPAGIDPAGLRALVGDVRDDVFGDIQSFLLATGNDAPAEYYFRGARRDAAVPVYSISKSVTSLLIGLALDSRAIDSVGVRLDTLLPTRRALLDADTLRARLTLRDLLTMRAGVAWNEFSPPYGSSGNPVTQMLASDDWIAFVLSQPMARAPGTAYTYNTGATVVLGAAVASALGRPIHEYAQDALFAPLGIPRPPWHIGPGGVTNAGSGVSLRPIDLVTIGRMVRDGGTRNGRTVIPAQWLEESLQPFSVAPLGARYGYQWWLLGPDGPWDPTHPVYLALGWGDKSSSSTASTTSWRQSPRTTSTVMR